MSKIALIVQREYLSRVRKRSFIIMTIIGPLLFATFLILPAWLSQVEDTGEKIIAVMETDEYNEPRPDSLRFFDVIPDKENLKFEYVPAPLDALKRMLSLSKYDAILYIPYNVMNSETVELFVKRQPSLGIEVYITQSLEKYIYNLKLIKNNIPPEVLISVRTNIALKTIRLEKDGSFQEQNQQDIKRWIGYICGFLIYFFIFFFGSQVMRGVIEEKTSRIVEIIVSSVRPFQLMMGKIIGVGMVGLTQFLIWIILTSAIVIVMQQTLGNSRSMTESSELTPESIFEAKPVQSQNAAPDETAEFHGYVKGFGEIPFLKVFAAFLFYFLGGFLLYGSLFAAIGSAVDSETDTQQFMLPVTIPLILSFFIMISAFTNPEGQLAVIFSIIPLTSPVVMMGRIGFDIPLIQIISSMLVLVLTFLGTTWFAGKIYRTGILMYGKKVSYKELWKWIRYKN
ncbi:MAG TPA: ABC transporter permease [Bacteroidales bacterium]|nr:ABC transporter permease [Bacteroidales bacterium]